MREYGYAAVAASRQAEAEAETGTRRNPLLFWLYRRLARQSAVRDAATLGSWTRHLIPSGDRKPVVVEVHGLDGEAPLRRV
jgi:hypothetical protein